MTSVAGSLDGGYTYTADIWSLGCVVIGIYWLIVYSISKCGFNFFFI